jgi:uncharacterized protein YsxB (DUF464 family)
MISKKKTAIRKRGKKVKKIQKDIIDRLIAKYLLRMKNLSNEYEKYIETQKETITIDGKEM